MNEKIAAGFYGPNYSSEKVKTIITAYRMIEKKPETRMCAFQQK